MTIAQQWEKEGFENFEIELQSDTRNDYNHENNMQLIPVECNQVIKGILVDESSRNQLNNATISPFENGVLKEEITLRNLEFQFNVTCNKFYKMVVEKANYKSKEIELSTNEINDFKFVLWNSNMSLGALVGLHNIYIVNKNLEILQKVKFQPLTHYLKYQTSRHQIILLV